MFRITIEEFELIEGGLSINRLTQEIDKINLKKIIDAINSVPRERKPKKEKV